MKIVTTKITDDIDGSADASTHTLALDGRAVEVDLSETHLRQLVDFLEPYLEAGRRPPRGNRRPAGAPTPAVVRAWWAEHPDDLPTWQPRGSIPSAVSRAYERRAELIAAHPAPTQRKARRKT